MKNHQVVTTSKLCKPLQHEGKLMQSLYTSEKSWENVKYIVDPVRSKLSNCKQVMSNIVIGKDKNDIEKSKKNPVYI